MEILLGIIGSTIVILCCCGLIMFECAWSIGGQYYINGNYGRRKSWLKRLLDGFEKLSKF